MNVATVIFPLAVGDAVEAKEFFDGDISRKGQLARTKPLIDEILVRLDFGVCRNDGLQNTRL